MQFFLRMIGGCSSGLVLRLTPGRYLFGRSGDCQVRFSENAVSRRHFAVVVGHSKALISDLGSRHGTAVNGQTITSEQVLRNGDLLSVAGKSFLVRIVRHECNLGSEYLTVPGEGHGLPVDIPSPQISGVDRRASGIGAQIYIDGDGPWLGGNENELEIALDLLLNGVGYVEWTEDVGPEWGINLLLNTDVDVAEWVARLTAWLQDWPVPDGTFMSVVAYQSAGGFKHQRIEIPSRPVCCT